MTDLFSTLPTEVTSFPSTDEEILSSEDKRDIARTIDDARRDSLDSDRALKEKLAFKTFRFMQSFVALIFVFVIYYVCYFAWFRLEIPKEVIIALITTSLAAVVGLVGFILKGLFGSRNEN